MTRKHFKALAEALRITEASRETITAIALVCHKANDNFDLSKFIEACNSCYKSKEAYDND